MKKTITSMLLALTIALSTSAVFAAGVDSQVTDSVTITNLKDPNGYYISQDPLVVKLQKAASMPMMKIAQSDVPDNMLSLLTALRASTAHVGLMSMDFEDPMMNIRVEAQMLAGWIMTHPNERNILDNIEYLDLQGALDSVLSTIH